MDPMSLQYLMSLQQQQQGLQNSPMPGGQPPYMGGQNQMMQPNAQAQGGFNPMPLEAPRSKPAMGEAATQLTQDRDNESNNVEIDPISSGAQRGVKASRASFEMNEDQKRQALGEALMAFFGKVGSSTHPSALGSMNEGFMPALQQFNAAKAQARGLNQAEYEQNWAEQKHAEDMAFRRDQEARLQQQGNAGELSAAKQVTLKKDYAKAVIGYENRKHKMVAEWVQGLPMEQRTPENIEFIKGEIDKELTADRENLKNFQDIGEAYGVYLPPYGEQQVSNDWAAGPDVGASVEAPQAVEPATNPFMTSDGVDTADWSVEDYNAEIARKEAAGEM